MSTWVPPMASAPAFAPSFEAWLNDLSSSWPTSVTTPILRAAADDDGASEAAVDAGADAAVDGGAAEGDVPPPLLQAAKRMAKLLNSVRPMERLCMCPPPTSR